VFPDWLCGSAISALGEFDLDAIDGNHIAAVSVEQHEYLPVRCGQRMRLAGNHYPVSAPINVASPVEIVRDSDLLAASFAQRHRSSGTVGCLPANFAANRRPSGLTIR